LSTELPFPETCYAETDWPSIAYQAFGSGGQDLPIVPGIVPRVEAHSQYTNCARTLHSLVQRIRVIFFDGRGQGPSERFEGQPTLEERMGEVRAVMQAAGSKPAVLRATADGEPMGALFLARVPHKA